MKTVLITGANRGIGLEFVKQYTAAGWRVFATARSVESASDLQALKKANANLSLLQLDIADEDSVQEFLSQFGAQSIDHLLHNAGIYQQGGESIDSVVGENILHHVQVNAVAPIILTQRLLPNLLTSQEKLVIVMSTKMSSIDDNSSGGCYSYRMSKTALNMGMKSVAVDLAGRDIKVLLLHPGWVKTEMGGPNGLITVQQSVTGLRQVIAEKGANAHGEFYTYDGKVVPW